MGYYINPEGTSKEEWVVDHGTIASRDAVRKFPFINDELPVCLLDNGWMIAAGIAYNAEERDRFLEDHIPIVKQRRKLWFFVKKELLKPWYSEEEVNGRKQTTSR